MIARIWRGAVPHEKAEEYLGYMMETGVQGYRAVAGNRGAYVLRRDAEDRSEFLLLTFWDSMEAVRRYAGPDPERAVYYPRDKEFLFELEPKVRHYEVIEG
jgi:heme-degrading monooxygenase HmoA